MYRFLGSVQPRGEVCAERLDCGHDWDDNFDGEPPVEVQALAFLTPSEAQVLLSKPWPARNWDEFHHPCEKPEHRIARLLGWNQVATE